MMHTISIEQKGLFFLKPLLPNEIGAARRLCDECVGENLYPEEELASAIGAEDKFFYLLKNESEEAVGYIYYRLVRPEDIAAYAKLDISLFRSLCRDHERKVGKIQSIGIIPEYRGIGLSTQMITDVLERMREAEAEIVFIACWKPGGIVPLAGVLSECGFVYLAEAKKIWYDDADLICPYCKGRCLCDAEIYYKTLD